MELNFKKKLILLLSAFLLTTVSAESSFNGFAGVSLDVQPVKKAIPEVFLKGVVAGQYNVTNSLSFKGNFQFTTSDVASHGFFQETPSLFSIHELSGTYTLFGKSSVMNFSALLGDQNSFGSDSFVSHTLGVRKFSSSLLTSQITPGSTGMNSLSGLGLSFTDTFGPNAIGVYCFYDKKNQNGPNQINTDVQYAFKTENVVFDTTFGLTMPFESNAFKGKKISDNIKKVVFRTGFSTLFNVSERMQLFLQAGLPGFVVPDLASIGLDDIFLFAEPRISLPIGEVNISFFCMPDAVLKNLPLITKPLGCSFNFQTLQFPFFSHTASVGFDITTSAARKPDIGNLDVVAAPYFNYSSYSGNFNTSIVFHPLDYTDVSKFFKVTFTYRTQF